MTISTCSERLSDKVLAMERTALPLLCRRSLSIYLSYDTPQLTKNSGMVVVQILGYLLVFNKLLQVNTITVICSPQETVFHL